jgi:hypothetical protein
MDHEATRLIHAARRIIEKGRDAVYGLAKWLGSFLVRAAQSTLVALRRSHRLISMLLRKANASQFTVVSTQIRSRMPTARPCSLARIAEAGAQIL